MVRTTPLMAAIAIMVASCASSGVTSPTRGSTTTSTGSTIVATTLTAPVSSTTTDGGASDDGSTTTEGEPTPTTVAPEPVAGPAPGSVWVVAGVAYDDGLNVRSGVGTGNEVIAVFAPTAEGIVATGLAMSIPGAIWWEVTLRDGSPGWVNASYLAVAGATDDITAAVVASLDSTPAEASTVADLASLVVATRDAGSAEMTVVSAPGGDDRHAETVIDLQFTGDDSVRGERIHVFAQRSSGDEAWSLLAVEATPLCWRGADRSGSCV